MNTGEQLPPAIQPVNPQAEQIREEDKIHLVLSYLGLLALIPLLTVKDSPFVTWHAKNGLVLGFGGVLILSIISAVLSAVCIGPVVGCFGIIGLLIVDVMAMLKALKGERWRIPGVTDIAEKL